MKNYFYRKVGKFVNECKPKYSRDIKEWFAEGGTIKIDINNGHLTWTYTNSVGDSVPYIDGYIKFYRKYMHPDDAIAEFSIDSFSGNRGTDVKKALEYINSIGYDEVPDGYVLHHDVNNGIIQLIIDKIHSQFTHIGGHSICGGE